MTREEKSKGRIIRCSSSSAFVPRHDLRATGSSLNNIPQALSSSFQPQTCPHISLSFFISAGPYSKIVQNQGGGDGDGDGRI